jgi:hypothetical protein
MPRSQVLSKRPAPAGKDRVGARADPSDGLLEACQRAVSRVLAELPDRDRRVLEEHRAWVVEVTHRETRAALEEIQGVLRRVA